MFETKVLISFEKGFAETIALLDNSSFAEGNFVAGTERLKGEILAISKERNEPPESVNQNIFSLVSCGVSADCAPGVLRVVYSMVDEKLKQKGHTCQKP
jgi:hypothetical protein